MITTKSIGDIIRQTRIALGLRIEDVMATTALSKSFLLDLEAGKETVQLAKVLIVLDNLGIKLQFSAPVDTQSVVDRRRVRV